MGDTKRGLYNKFEVSRTDGGSRPGKKHHGCEYFVLDLTHDKHAEAALRAYADSCAAECPLLAADLRAKYGHQRSFLDGFEAGVIAERERCAKVCEEVAEYAGTVIVDEAERRSAQACAEAIRGA